MGARKTVRTEETDAECSVTTCHPSRITRASARRLSAAAASNGLQEDSAQVENNEIQTPKIPLKSGRKTSATKRTEQKERADNSPSVSASFSADITQDESGGSSNSEQAEVSTLSKTLKENSPMVLLEKSDASLQLPTDYNQLQTQLKDEKKSCCSAEVVSTRLLENNKEYPQQIEKALLTQHSEEVSASSQSGTSVEFQNRLTHDNAKCSVTGSLEVNICKEQNANISINNLNHPQQITPTKVLISPAKLALQPRIIDSEKQKRLNAELQRLTQEITFENTLKPVRIQQVQAFNPFRQFSTATEESRKGTDTDWASLAKMWVKTGEESSKVGEQLEEIERRRLEKEERMIEEQRRKLEEETLKKREIALALAQKLVQESQQKIAQENRNNEEAKQCATATERNSTKAELPLLVPVAPSAGLQSSPDDANRGRPRSPSSQRSTSRRRSYSRSCSKSTKSRSRSRTRSRSHSYTRYSRSRRSVSRDRRRSSVRRRSRSRERWHGRPHVYSDRRGGRFGNWRGDSHRNRWNSDRKFAYRRDERPRSPSPIRKNDRRSFKSRSRERSRSLSISRRSRSPEERMNTPTEDVFKTTAMETAENIALESVPLPFENIQEVPPVPPFQEIFDLIYLDDKVSKIGKKIKRVVEKSVQCDCYVKGLDCSDSRCLNRQMLFECRKCKATNCQNQRFRKHQYAAVEPFYTGPKKGFGVRAKELIKKDTFIIEYIGEVVTQEDFAERVKKYAKDPKHTHHYIFEMGQKLIDATIKGNFSRFINHSCEPNAICLKWAVPRSPKDCSRIGFFASCDILPGEEITFDYQFINYGKKAQTCHCGTPSCKGVIGQTVEDDEEDDEDDDDLDEEDESDDELETEADRLKKEREAEIREWESQQQINDIISAGKVPPNKANVWAARLVKNLMRVDEIGYKLRVLSFLEHTDPQFYQILKRKSLFDVFASWLSPTDWSRNDMELKLEVIRLISLQDCQDSNIDQAAGWTVLCCQTVEQLAETEVPSVLAVRDSMEYVMDMVCGKEDFDEDESGNKDLTNEELFQKVQESAQTLIQSKKFSEQKRSCAVSKFKIPKKVKQERQAAAENPASIYEGQARRENIARSERREHFFSRSERYRFHRYNRSPNGYDSRGLKRRYEMAHMRRNRYYEPDFKRNRTDYDYPRKHDYRHDAGGKHRQEEGRPRTPPLEPTMQQSTSVQIKSEQQQLPYCRASGDVQPPPGLVIPTCNPIHASIDMELSTGDSPQATSFMPIAGFVNATQQPQLSALPSNTSLRLEVPESPFGAPLASYTSSYLNEVTLNQHTSHHSDNPYLGEAFNYPHTIPGWEMSINEDMIYHHLFSMTKEQRASQLDYHKLYVKIISKVNNDVKRIEQEQEEAKKAIAIAAQTTKGMDNSQAILSSAQYPPPPPPPPRKKESKWWRVRVAGAVGDDQFYYWNKETHQTQWEVPAEPYDDYEQQMQPDSSVDVEEKPIIDRAAELFKNASAHDDRMSSSSSIGRPSSRNSQHSSSSAHFAIGPSGSVDIKEDEKTEKKHNYHRNLMDSQRRASPKQEFLKALEKTIKPVMWDFLRKIMSADTERRNWLLKQVCKEMYKKETLREDCTMTLTKDVQKRIINYTKRFMERKCAGDGKDLWKGYDLTHPLG